MLLSEAKEILKKNGYQLVEDTDDWDEADLGVNSYNRNKKTFQNKWVAHHGDVEMDKHNFGQSETDEYIDTNNNRSLDNKIKNAKNFNLKNEKLNPILAYFESKGADFEEFPGDDEEVQVEYKAILVPTKGDEKYKDRNAMSFNVSLTYDGEIIIDITDQTGYLETSSLISNMKDAKNVCKAFYKENIVDEELEFV